MSIPFTPEIEASIEAAIEKIMKSVDDAIAAERARCKAVIRGVCGIVYEHVSQAIIEEIERGETDA